MVNMIPRLLYSSLVKQMQVSNKIIILYGSRQVGKTTLITEVLKSFQDKRILRINADRREYYEVLSSRDYSALKRLVDNYEYLFIDEAQRIHDIGINLKILHDEIPTLQIVVTGSSSLELANTLKEPLTGRTWTYILFPIAVSEFRSNESIFELDHRLEEFLLYGMYPEVFSLPSSRDKIVYLRELSATYLYKDIFELADVRNPDVIFRLLQLLAYQVGSTVSLNELGRQLGISKETVDRYLGLLEKAFVIYRLSGFSRNLRKEVVKMDKIFFYDLGIRNAVINDFRELSLRTDVGQLWENFLLIERIKKHAYEQQFANRYYWRTYTGAELDYIEESQGSLDGFEFKWTNKPVRAPSTWLDTYENATFQVISRQNYLDFILADGDT